VKVAQAFVAPLHVILKEQVILGRTHVGHSISYDRHQITSLLPHLRCYGLDT
jgi:hypothetical protein